MSGTEDRSPRELVWQVFAKHRFVTFHVDQKRQISLRKGGCHFLRFDPVSTNLYWDGKECKNFMRVANYLTNKSEAAEIQTALVDGISLFKKELKSPEKENVEIANYATDFAEAQEESKPWFSDELTKKIRYKLSIDQAGTLDWTQCKIEEPKNHWERIGMMNEVASLAPWCDVPHADVLTSIHKLAVKEKIGHATQSQFAKGKRRILNLYHGGLQGMLAVFVSPGRAETPNTNPEPITNELLGMLTPDLEKTANLIASRWHNERLAIAFDKLVKARSKSETLDAILVAVSPCACINVRKVGAAEDFVQKSLHWDNVIKCWDGYTTTRESEFNDPVTITLEFENMKCEVQVEPLLQGFESNAGMSRLEIESRLQTLVAAARHQRSVRLSRRDTAGPSKLMIVSLISGPNFLKELLASYNSASDGSLSASDKDKKDRSAEIAILKLWLDASLETKANEVDFPITAKIVKKVLSDLNVRSPIYHPCSEAGFTEHWIPMVQRFSIDGTEAIIPTFIPNGSRRNGGQKGGHEGVTVTLPRLTGAH